jgi:hypothetical protein
MGLDWNPLARPRAGKEAEFDRLFSLLNGKEPLYLTVFSAFFGISSPKRKREKRLGMFREISESPFETLGAPRVGFDAPADDWLRAKLEAKGRAGDFENARRQMRGFFVLDLLPPCDGFPLYTNYPHYEGLDRYSFRAQFLNDCREVIGSELHERAWERMRARELAAYADELEAKVRPWAERQGVADVEHVTEPPDLSEDAPASKAHVLFSAIRWCRFWAARGHGLDTWS